MYGKGLLKGLWITFKHSFEKKDLVVRYPEQMPHLQERFRGSLAFDFEKCIACGICIRNCPNNVLSMETAKDEDSKKKKLMQYTIDLQYCMFCNLCVEDCPTNSLYFTHDFELSQFHRDDIKRVYHRPPELDQQEAAQKTSDQDTQTAADDKKEKQLRAMINAINKTPHKVLARAVDSEEQAEVLAAVLQADEKKLARMAEMMITDKEKAKKIALALVKKELKEREKGGDQ